jgi:hypothetical protein
LRAALAATDKRNRKDIAHLQEHMRENEARIARWTNWH